MSWVNRDDGTEVGPESQFDRIITQLLTDITHFCLPVGSRPTSTNDVINIAQGIPPLPRISTPVSLLIK